MSKPKERVLLSTSKPGPDYHWFRVIVDGYKSFTVHDEDVVWIVDNKTEHTTITTYRTWKKSEGKKRLSVKKVEIRGPKRYLQNLMRNMGMATPDLYTEPPWLRKNEREEWEI